MAILIPAETVNKIGMIEIPFEHGIGKQYAGNIIITDYHRINLSVSGRFCKKYR